jgi:hypothetical protein
VYDNQHMMGVVREHRLYPWPVAVPTELSRLTQVLSTEKNIVVREKESKRRMVKIADWGISLVLPFTKYCQDDVTKMNVIGRDI